MTPGSPYITVAIVGIINTFRRWRAAGTPAAAVDDQGVHRDDRALAEL